MMNEEIEGGREDVAIQFGSGDGRTSVEKPWIGHNNHFRRAYD